MKKLLVLILSLTFSLGLLSFTGCSNSKSNSPLNENDFNVSSSTENGLGIVTLTSQTVVTENERYLEKTLQASVSGSLVNAKPIDLEWYVTWFDSTKVEDLSSILTVSESSEDQTVCSVKLFQPLNDIAVIVVRCKNNGISATCMVEYNSKSYSTKFVGASGLPISKHDTVEGLPALELIPGQVVEFKMNSYDFFGNDIGVSKTLRVNGSDSYGAINMTYLGVPGSVTEHQLSEFVNPTDIYVTPYILWDFNEETGILRIEAVTALEDLCINSVSPTVYDKFNSVSTPYVPYFKIDLVDDSNLEVGVQFSQVLVRVERPVSLSIDNSNIMFE